MAEVSDAPGFFHFGFFLPDKPGEYEFACQMGMLRGKLIVE